MKKYIIFPGVFQIIFQQENMFQLDFCKSPSPDRGEWFEKRYRRLLMCLGQSRVESGEFSR